MGVISNGFMLLVLISLCLYYIVPDKLKWIVLMAVSFAFYYICSGRYIAYIVFSILVTYTTARLIEKNEEYKKALLTAGIILNIAGLCITKYAGFVISNISAVLRMEMDAVHLVVPLGISFFTFQTVAYMVDVYRGDIKSEKNIFKYALFVSYFPQIIQGPISRYKDLSVKLYSPHKWDTDRNINAVSRMVWGIFKKLVISESAFIAVSAIMGDGSEISGIFVMLLYMLMLYTDFSGGIDVIMGVSMLFGIELKENFMQPFFASSVSEFWRRWHITLGTWFRDYIYIPLGGNRVSKGRLVFNIGIIWIITGLWHGANWNYILWGIYFGVFVLLEKLVLHGFLKKHKVFSHIYTLIVVPAGFVIFSQEDLSLVGKIFADFFNMPVSGIVPMSVIIAKTVGIVMLIIAGVIREKNIVISGGWKRFVFIVVILLLVGLMGPKGAMKGFIYAQF